MNRHCPVTQLIIFVLRFSRDLIQTQPPYVKSQAPMMVLLDSVR
jgi:hypothetical protein